MLKVMTVTRFGALWSMAMLKVMTVTRFGEKMRIQNRAHDDQHRWGLPWQSKAKKGIDKVL